MGQGTFAVNFVEQYRKYYLGGIGVSFSMYRISDSPQSCTVIETPSLSTRCLVLLCGESVTKVLGSIVRFLQDRREPDDHFLKLLITELVEA